MTILKYIKKKTAMKKRFFLTSLLFLGGLFAVSAAEVAPEKTSLNILAIGNSFSRPLSRYLPTMARSAGCRVHFENLYIGGGSMQTHWNNIEKEEDNPEFKYFKKFSYRQKLAERKWDFVTIQQASDKSWDIETYRPYAQNLRDYIKTHAPAAEVLLHQTWAYRQDDRRLKKFKLTQQTMFEKIFAANNEIGKELQLRVLPVGSAIQLARETEPVKFVPFEQQTFEYPALPSLEGSFVGDQKLRWSKDHKRVEGDAAHLNHRGEFIQACVWFAVLFNRPVSDIKFAPAEFSPEDVAFMKETAQKVVDSFEQPVRQDEKAQREMNQFEKKN